MQRNTPQCGVTKQCVAKECGAKMWRHRTMWRHQTMWRQNVASQENVASPSNVAPNNAAPKCGATGKCGVTKQCGAKQCSANMWRHRKMRRHQTMWRQTMWRHMSSKCVFIMCLQRQVEKCVLFCQHRGSFLFMVQLSDKLRPCSSISHSPKNLELAHSKRCWWWPILLGTPNENWHVPLKRTFHLPNINFQGICLFFGGFFQAKWHWQWRTVVQDLPTRVGLSDRKEGFVVLDYMSEFQDWINLEMVANSLRSFEFSGILHILKV